jgi:hypothetical protein
MPTDEMPTYEEPGVTELGSVEDLTLNHCHKPCTCPDGMGGSHSHGGTSTS